VLGVPDEDALLEIRVELLTADIEAVLILEGDEPYVDQAMAIGLKPVLDKTKIKKVLSRLKLYGPVV